MVSPYHSVFYKDFVTATGTRTSEKDMKANVKCTIPPGGIAERDSRKDQAVVFIFIVATAGLLTWAAVKPWVGVWIEVRFNISPPSFSLFVYYLFFSPSISYLFTQIPFFPALFPSTLPSLPTHLNHHSGQTSSTI